MNVVPVIIGLLAPTNSYLGARSRPTGCGQETA
jgi:hypothetical protein